jgi:small subunit ribosomal protein S16
MAVAIRLARQGSKKNPYYRLVAADKRSPRDGRFIELLGHYDPRGKNATIDLARLDHWLACGAQVSATVAELVKRARKDKAAPVA